MNPTPAAPESTRPLAPTEIREALTEIPDWRHRLFGIYTAYECASSAEAIQLMSRIGQACEQLEHHADLDWRVRHLFISSASHDVGGAVTERDLQLARRISSLAAEGGATAVAGENRTVDIALDTKDLAAQEEFWRTALGYVKDERTGDLRDPHRRGPGFWFQITDHPDAHPMHLDITAPMDAWTPTRERLTPLSQDGREDDRFAPWWWIYTDADGNRVCLCNGEQNADDPDA